MLSKISHSMGRLDRGLFLLVAVPVILTALYFAFFASDVFTSEARFVVRVPQASGATSLGSLLQGAGFSKAPDEGQTVRDYILSRDALRVLEEKLHLKAAYGGSNVDFLSRFGGFGADDSFEALHRYYQRKVDVQTDSSSSIVTVIVKAYTAQDAANTNRVLLEQSEDLVNRLNERGRRDLIRYAQDEVAVAEKKAKTAALALSGYRNAQSVVDPEKQATVQLQQIAKLQDELLATTNQLSQLQTFTPANPQIAALKNRARAMRDEIADQASRVTGGKASLTNKAADYQQLALESEFANKQLASALASLEHARNEAQRQQVYLERIAQPSVPDVAQEPRRIRSVLATFLLGVVAWGILTMLLAGIREHRD
jgi:capsular polysaccharide transport system permease protein